MVKSGLLWKSFKGQRVSMFLYLWKIILYFNYLSGKMYRIFIGIELDFVF